MTQSLQWACWIIFLFLVEPRTTGEESRNITRRPLEINRTCHQRQRKATPRAFSLTQSRLRWESIASNATKKRKSVRHGEAENSPAFPHGINVPIEFKKYGTSWGKKHKKLNEHRSVQNLMHKRWMILSFRTFYRRPSRKRKVG